MYFFHEGPEVCEDLLWRLAGVDVIAAGIEQDQTRLVRQHDAVGKENAVRELRAAKAPVEHAMVREISREGGPLPNARAADKDDASFFRRMLAIGGLESRDLFFPFC